MTKEEEKILRQEAETPQQFFDVINALYGEFNLDTCASEIIDEFKTTWRRAG